MKNLSTKLRTDGHWNMFGGMPGYFSYVRACADASVREGPDASPDGRKRARYNGALYSDLLTADTTKGRYALRWMTAQGYAVAVVAHEVSPRDAPKNPHAVVLSPSRVEAARGEDRLIGCVDVHCTHHRS